MNPVRLGFITRFLGPRPDWGCGFRGPKPTTSSRPDLRAFCPRADMRYRRPTLAFVGPPRAPLPFAVDEAKG